eukprot:c20699_g1_i1 orf=296-1102(+)
MFKSQLQEYAQKAGLKPPVYEFVREGPSHEPLFKASVTLQGITYESPPGFTKVKKAEHAAAQAALAVLANSGAGFCPNPLVESGLCKNVLQEYAQKCGLPLPAYHSERSGEVHSPAYTSTVEIAGVQYKGGSARNKQEAEIKAAKIALLAIHAESRATFQAVQTEMNVSNSQNEVTIGKKRGHTERQSGKFKSKKNAKFANAKHQEPSAVEKEQQEVLVSVRQELPSSSETSTIEICGLAVGLQSNQQVEDGHIQALTGKDGILVGSA